METGHIEKFYKSPDSGGQVFVMVFSILPLDKCMIFFHIYVKGLTWRHHLQIYKDKSLSYFCFQICIVLSVSLGSASLSVLMDQSPAMSYGIRQNVFPVPN